MTRSPKKSITIASIILVVILLIGYTLFQAKNLIRGPILIIDAPLDGDTVPYEVVDISGSAENISAISLNDSPIFVDKDGKFLEKVVVAPGYSIIKISARDRFNRTVTKYLHLVLKENRANQTSISSPPPVATTTPI
jgi:hypothetical protein